MIKLRQRFKSSRPVVFFNKGGIKILQNFTGKSLCQSLFFLKLKTLNKRLRHRCFPATFAKFLRTWFFTHLVYPLGNSSTSNLANRNSWLQLLFVVKEVYNEPMSFEMNRNHFCSSLLDVDLILSNYNFIASRSWNDIRLS